MFGLDRVDVFPPRYNIAPTQPILVVRLDQADRREAALVRWGLIPSWTKQPNLAGALINARAETAADKPSFRGPFRHRRCLIPADGFYEWTGARGAKQPHLIQLKSRELFAFAGLWEHWLGADGSEIETAVILTTTANVDIAPIHDRMPVILPSDGYDRWLDCRPGTSLHVADLLAPPSNGLLDAQAVTRMLNDPRAEGPELHAPAATQGQLL